MTVKAAQARGIDIPGKAETISELDQDLVWPVVDFVPAKHAAGRQYARSLIPRMSVSVMNAHNKPEATSQQVPLVLAWVSQALTVPRVWADTRR